MVQNEEQFLQCVEAFQGLIISAPAECAKVTGYAIGKGHHVFLSMSPEAIDPRIISLSRIKPGALEKSLREAGLSEADAATRARESGRSIDVTWRRLLVASGKEPAWAKAELAPLLLPVLLAGAWVDDLSGDQQILETLSGKSHADFIKNFKKWHPLRMLLFAMLEMCGCSRHLSTHGFFLPGI